MATSLSTDEDLNIHTKAKAQRKRTRLWNFFFHHHHKKHVSSKTQEMISQDEQLAKITTLADYAERHFAVMLDDNAFQSVLIANDWNLKSAIADLEDYEEAAHGILRPLPSAQQALLGSENDQGTSCYIDSLLFAMFISITAFEPLLTFDIPSEEVTKQKLQTLLRLFVNKLRKGHLVKDDFVSWIRKTLEELSWHGKDASGHWSQEDASELFLFLTETLNLPYLPFQSRLFHGANKDADDDRVMTERALSLAIPPNVSSKLESVLIDHFYNGTVTGVRRQVDYHELVPSSPTSTESKSSKKTGVVECREEVDVAAWQVLELLPFYSAVNEQGETIITQAKISFPDSRMVLPIVLKRYQYDELGGCVKIQSRVEVPLTIPFHQFVNKNADAPLCPACQRNFEFVMHLRSAVCHKGETPHSGHYIAYARKDTEQETVWLKLDDMKVQKRVQVLSNSSVVFEELAKDGYILFYELDQECTHCSPLLKADAGITPDMLALDQDKDSRHKMVLPFPELITPFMPDNASPHSKTSARRAPDPPRRQGKSPDVFPAMDLISFAKLNGRGSNVSVTTEDTDKDIQARQLQQKFWQKLTEECAVEGMDHLARHAHVGQISQADPHSSFIQRRSVTMPTEEGDSMFGEDIPFEDIEEVLQDIDHVKDVRVDKEKFDEEKKTDESLARPDTAPLAAHTDDIDEDDMFGDDIPLDEVDAIAIEQPLGSLENNNTKVKEVNSHTDYKSSANSWKGVDTVTNKYVRYMVADITVQMYRTDSQEYSLNEKLLLLIDQQLHCPTYARLRGSWLETTVTIGDIVHIPFAIPGTKEIIIDDKTNFLVVHPDYLVSCTTVAESVFCRRKSVLQQKIKSLGDYSEPLVYGDIMHRVLQDALISGDFSVAGIRDAIQRMVMDSLDALYAIGQTETTAIHSLSERIRDIKSFGDIYVGSEPKPTAAISNDIGPDAASSLNCTSVAITRVLDIEEHIWSPTYGLKGMIDVSIELKLHPSSHILLVPLELKTGKASRFISHRAQTMLYTLLMRDRYDINIATGALFYSLTNRLYLVPALHGELRALMMARNSLAVAMKSGRGLPPMIKNLHSCQHCAMNDACLIYHKSIENGTSKSSGLEKWFDKRTEHITDSGAAFFRHWQRLIDMEEDDIDNIRKDIWNMTASTREMTGKCFENMALNLAHGEAKQRIYVFKKACAPTNEESLNLLSSQFSVGDPIIISSMEGHINLSMGFVLKLEKYSITVKLQSTLRDPPKKRSDFDELKNEAFSSSSFAKSLDPSMTYRIDKDEMAGGVALMRQNLVTLLSSEENGGDTKRRRLIVDRAMPVFNRFESNEISKLSQLNPDQRNAIEKVLSAKDYTLILGMPGTGKTTTTACLIKELVDRKKSVLVTAYTHTALDNVLLKVRESGVDVLRLGNMDKETIQTMPALRDCMLNGNATLTSVSAIEEFCNSKQVVGTTCLGIGHQLFRRRKFDYCIVDEASQITLPTCIGPLQFADVFVLVGDQYQLPPVIRNKQARQDGFARSLFTLLAEAHPQSIVFLEYQYRMNKEIMSVSNALIYDNKLKCGNEQVASRCLDLPQFREGLRNIHRLWQDSLDSSKKCRESCCWLKHVLDRRSQLRWISRHLGGRQDLEVSTIDKYQGRDKDCVLISLVRSNSQGNSGDLLKDWRRINVAFTRARRKLIVFGSLSTLESSSLFSDFLKLLRQNNWIYKLPEDAHTQHDIGSHIFSSKAKEHKTFTSTPAILRNRPILRDIYNEAVSS
ncbi:Tripartite DNA replication factor [Apophysomyces ossiformis]|uniref:DNA replication ATP-dependent helicase/nuclease n=1 Tax=Apophysomyces ossiformis TaxID=679940 RepID=A0A8H7BVX4_9FUNG|nr:Tripartite DNA replication factor [Apophysomyces ossiformis]